MGAWFRWSVIGGGVAIGAGVAVALVIDGGWMGAVRGRREAQREWDAGQATIYIHGHFQIGHFLDARTGLPRKSIAGCLVNHEIMRWEQEHNDRIMDLIAMHGLPAYSWVVREPGVCGMEAMWKRRVAAGQHAVTMDVERETGVVHVACGLGGAAVHVVGLYRKPGYGKGVDVGFMLDGKQGPVMGDTGVVELLGGEKSADLLYVRFDVDYRPELMYGALEAGSGRWVNLEIAKDEGLD